MYDLYVKTCLTIIQRPSAKGGNFHKDNYLYCDVSQILPFAVPNIDCHVLMIYYSLLKSLSLMGFWRILHLRRLDCIPARICDLKTI